MKTFPLLFLTGASLVTMVQSLSAETPPQSSPADPFIKNPGDAVTAGKQEENRLPNYLLVLETYTMDKSEALALLESERGSTARYRRVSDLVKSGRARLDILTALAARSGDRSLIEGVDEVRYATEFASPKAKAGLAAPTAFDTRKAGDTLEFESVISPDGRVCDLNIFPQSVDLAGFRDIGAMAQDSAVSQPDFGVRKITTSATFPVNEPHYLGSFSPAARRGLTNDDAPSEMRLAFVRFNSVMPSAEELKPPARPMDWSAINLEYRIYSLDRPAALEIVSTMPDLQAPWKKLQGLLSEKKARFEHLVSVQTKSGQRAVTEELQEVRFATAYAHADHAASIETITRTSTTRPESPKGDQPDPKEEAKGTTTSESATIARTMPGAEIVPGSPAAFEMRNAGLSVEVEATVSSDGLSLDLLQSVHSVTYLGDLKATGVAARYPAQPLFESRSITTSQRLVAGRQGLLGTFNPPGADGVNDRTDSGRTWLIFVRATSNEP